MPTRLRFWLLALLLLLPAGAAQARQQGGHQSDALFMEASLDNAAPWVGQEVRLTYTLFFSGPAPQIEDKAKPEHPGLWAREIEPETYIDSAPASVRGIRFRKAVVRQLRLAAMQGGTLSVTGYRLRCLVPKSSAMRLDTRDDAEIILTAPTVTLEARPLPRPVPDGFSGAVGRFTVTVAPVRSKAHAGEPLDLLVTLSGTGNLDTLPTLTVTLPEGVRRQESATPTIVASKREGSRSSLTAKITLIPGKTGQFRFRPVVLIGFDPQKGAYETIVSNEIAIEVLPATATAPPLQTAQTAPAEPTDEPAATPWQTVMIAMSGAVLTLIFGLHWRQMKREQRPRPAPVKTVAKADKADVPRPAPARWNTPESVRKALYEATASIGIRNPVGLTSGELGKKLQEKGVPAATLGEVMELLTAIDHALYAPGQASPESMEAMSRNAAGIIARLSKHG